MTDFSKEFFQKAWGAKGYYEHFAYGVGIDRVCEVALYPFLNLDRRVLEIGSGGGTFTELIYQRVDHITAIDVIEMPSRFAAWPNLKYIELNDQCFSCEGVASESIDFSFSYNVFCHLSNESLQKYLCGVNRVLEPDSDFVFMLSNFAHAKKHFPDHANYQLGDMLPVGHFYQDERTLDLIIGEGWRVVNRNMIPEHRDIIIHLQKI